MITSTRPPIQTFASATGLMRRAMASRHVRQPPVREMGNRNAWKQSLCLTCSFMVQFVEQPGWMFYRPTISDTSASGVKRTKVMGLNSHLRLRSLAHFQCRHPAKPNENVSRGKGAGRMANSELVYEYPRTTKSDSFWQRCDCGELFFLPNYWFLRKNRQSQAASIGCKAATSCCCKAFYLASVSLAALCDWLSSAQVALDNIENTSSQVNCRRLVGDFKLRKILRQEANQHESQEDFWKHFGNLLPASIFSPWSLAPFDMWKTCSRQELFIKFCPRLCFFSLGLTIYSVLAAHMWPVGKSYGGRCGLDSNDFFAWESKQHGMVLQSAAFSQEQQGNEKEDKKKDKKKHKVSWQHAKLCSDTLLISGLARWFVSSHKVTVFCQDAPDGVVRLIVQTTVRQTTTLGKVVVVRTTVLRTTTTLRRVVVVQTTVLRTTTTLGKVVVVGTTVNRTTTTPPPPLPPLPRQREGCPPPPPGPSPHGL